MQKKSDTVFYPQDEMTTALLPVTCGCSYNQCVFCSMYKDDCYAEIPIYEIEMNLKNMYRYTEKVFLTGADPLAIGYSKMKKILELIQLYLPYCACVSSYASIRNISIYTVEELSVLHHNGLRLLYIGFESGSDETLKFMKKSHSVSDAIEQAKKLNKANLRFNTIIMYGMAGVNHSVENGIQTAKMINQFETVKVITMNLTIFADSALYQMVKIRKFIPPSRKERLLEIKTLLMYLEPKKQMVFDTTHPTNIIKIKGTLPQDKEYLMEFFNKKIEEEDCLKDKNI